MHPGRRVSGLASYAALGSMIAVAACGARTAERPASPDPRHGAPTEIQIHGALRAMFHEGRIGPAVTLDALLPSNDLYAVGALADLTGEVTVVAGEAYLSYPEGDRARTEVARRSDAAAALLVSANVPRWRSATTETIVRFEELDEAIARLATSTGLDPGGRFPFLIEGVVEDLRWHVIDGRRLVEGGDSHEDHLAASVRESRARTPATLVGFYSTGDQGVFTHMGSRTHVHCIVEKPVAAGHVDHVVLPAGTVVRFPG